MDWGVFYIIGNLLKLKCLKWSCITHLDIWNPSYGQKKGRESDWQFDSQPLKVRNRPNLLVWRWFATYHWKALEKGYNFTLDLVSIRVINAKLWAPKLQESQLWQFFNSHFGVPGQNAIWMWVWWKGTKYTIRGKVMASHKSGLWWVLWVWIAHGSS
jgi:hypothetical protein